MFESKWLSKAASWYLSKNAFPYWCVLFIDCAIIVTSGVMSSYACLGARHLIPHFWTHHLMIWVYSLPFFILGMRIQHTYSGVLRYTTTVDFMRIAMSTLCGTLALVVARLVLPIKISESYGLAWRVIGVMFLLAVMGQWALRVFMKYMYESAFSTNSKRVFIYGVREGGVSVARSINADPEKSFRLAGFVSPDGSFESKRLLGVKVHKAGDSLIRHMDEERAMALIVSPMQVDAFRENKELIDKLIAAKKKIIMSTGTEEWKPGSDISKEQLHEVDIEDLLPRDKIQVDMKAIGEMLASRRILITGAAGSIGYEMVRQVARFIPKELILIDQAETPMHDVRLFMSKKYPNIKCETIVGSITNATQMETIFKEHKPEYVFHAAAYKHVPMMEDNPAMAVQNNVYGTRVIADLAVKYGTKKFVMISTDKAVNPTNVMGCSKRICEIYCQSLNRAIELDRSGNTTGTAPRQANGAPAVTQFITTRFGNVLGSNGSVIPLFKEQIRRGGPVTVTHPDIIRFFMLIPEACQLVLEAGTMGKGGEIFIFDMGKPVRIADLAYRMIELSGAKNVKVEYTGLRDGEKLYEEVLNDAEQTKPTHHPKIKIAAVREYDYAQALANEKELYDLSFSYDDMAIVKKMKQIVPEYKSQHSKYEELD